MGAGQTLALADNATAKRVKGVLYAMQTLIENSAPSSGMSKMALIILPALADEMTAEMEDLDEMTIRVIMSQIGEIIAWIGHGDNSRLPDSLRDFAEGIQPSGIESNGDDVGRIGRSESSTDNDDSDDRIIEAEIVE